LKTKINLHYIHTHPYAYTHTHTHHKVRTTQRIEHAPIGKTNGGRLYEEIVAVYCKNISEFLNTVWVKCNEMLALDVAVRVLITRT